MSLREFFYFLKFLFWDSLIVEVFKILRSFLFPKVWMLLSLGAFIVFRVMKYFGVETKLNIDGFLIIFLVSWAWLVFDQGEWKHKMREGYKQKWQEEKDTQASTKQKEN